MAQSSISPIAVRPWQRVLVLLLIIFPLLLAGAVVAFILYYGTGLAMHTVLPGEQLTIDSVTFPTHGQIEVSVSNTGSQPLTIAQVKVDDAIWMFTLKPDKPLDPQGKASMSIPYPWIEHATHTVTVMTSTGKMFEQEVTSATLTTGPDPDLWKQDALLGLYLGVIPVLLGLAWYPFLRRTGHRGMHLALGLTIGLLVWLLVNTFKDALTVVGTAPPGFGGAAMVFLLAVLAFLILLALGIGRKGQAPSPTRTSYVMALGVGLHNLGEGLVLSIAVSSGNAGLSMMLIFAFLIRNLLKGGTIAAPLARTQSAWRHLVPLAALAGVPALIGTLLGRMMSQPLLVTTIVALAAGAIAYVIFAVYQFMARQSEEEHTPVLSSATFAGLFIGIALTYATVYLMSV